MPRATRLLTAGLAAGAIALSLGGCATGEPRSAPGEPRSAPGPTPSSAAAMQAPTLRPTPSPSRTRSAAPSRAPAPSSSPSPSRTYRLTTTPSGQPERVLVSTAGGKALVDAPLKPERLDDEGALAPPPGVVGWYAEAGWPKPGFPGASILAGHVNTRKLGADTFARLPQARPGATVTVVYDSGEAVRFVVTRSKAVSKREVPKDDSIWDAGNPRPLLRLITCDPTTPVKGGHYVGNWVLWASPV